jgi:L-malate glycosyltransferase
MKILFVSNRNPYGHDSHGGAETSMRLLAEKMAARGHHVTYLTRGATLDQRKIALEDNVTLKSWPGLNDYFFSYFPSIESWILTLWIFAVSLRSNIELLYCFYQANVLKSALNVRRVVPRLKVVMRMAGKFWYEQALCKPKYKLRYERYFSQIDAVNYISRDLVSMTTSAMEELRMHFQFRDSFILDIGSSIMSVRSAPYHVCKAQPFKVVMAARFSSYAKRQDLLLRAIALIPDHEQIELLLIGEGARRHEMERLAEQLAIRGRVGFMPFLSQEELWKEMEGAQLLCHCVDYEGLGKVVIESMAMGLPVLASHVSPLSSYIVEGRTGFLAKNQPVAWAEKLVQLRHSPGLLKMVSQGSMEYVRKQHDPDKNVIGYEKEFASIVAQKS